MKRIAFLLTAFLITGKAMKAQDDVYPAPAYKGVTIIKNATIHVGNGTVINNGSVKIVNGKITEVGSNIAVPADDVKVFDATGKHLYPGLILPVSDLGIREIISGVRASNDYREIGEWNSNVKSVKAYNADSRITNTLKANGILLTNVTPVGSLIGGASSVVQMDAWNYEDALYKENTALNFYMPSLVNRRGGRGGFGGGAAPAGDPVKAALSKIDEVKAFLQEAKAYLQESNHTAVNLRFESLKPLFDKKQKLFIHADQVKQLLVAVDFVKEFGFDVVIVGGSESYQIADLLKMHNISVILQSIHALPTLADDDISQPFKTPAILQKAGVLYALNDNSDNGRYRNLSYNAGTAVAYGLTKEQALQAITLNAAKILGIDKITGSIEVNKDANIIISEGDILDMRTSAVTDAWIQGRKVSLENKQTQLFDRYQYKYGLKK